ncbi:Hypothetical predicted protein [Pelobates cultripes]|uniref:Uncharacterized protein n=1 Tax=Pelobates cultripes TaxID=61616 RepID=A0AAD1WPH3_PELCU|nr:Hypothetical predicted protein [Pelobates cultripes]
MGAAMEAGNPGREITESGLGALDRRSAIPTSKMKTGSLADEPPNHKSHHTQERPDHKSQSDGVAGGPFRARKTKTVSTQTTNKVTHASASAFTARPTATQGDKLALSYLPSTTKQRSGVSTVPGISAAECQASPIRQKFQHQGQTAHALIPVRIKKTRLKLLDSEKKKTLSSPEGCFHISGNKHACFIYHGRPLSKQPALTSPYQLSAKQPYSSAFLNKKEPSHPKRVKQPKPATFPKKDTESNLAIQQINDLVLEDYINSVSETSQKSTNEDSVQSGSNQVKIFEANIKTDDNYVSKIPQDVSYSLQEFQKGNGQPLHNSRFSAGYLTQTPETHACSVKVPQKAIDRSFGEQKIIQEPTVSSFQELQNVYDNYFKKLQTSSASSSTKLLNSSAPSSLGLQNSSASSSTKLQNSSASSSTKLQNSSAFSYTKLQNSSAHSSKELQNSSALTSLELQNSSAPSSTELQNSSAPSSTELQNSSAPSSTELQNSSAPSSTKLQNSSVPSSTELLNSSALSSLEFRNSSAHSSKELQNSSSLTSLQLQNSSAPSSTELQNSSVPSSTELLNSSALSSLELWNSSAPSSKELQNSSALTSPELQNSSALTSPELQNSSTLSSTELQSSSALTSLEFQNSNTLSSLELQDSSAPSSTELQNFPASSSTALQNFSAPSSTELQNLSVSHSTELQNASTSFKEPKEAINNEPWGSVQTRTSQEVQQNISVEKEVLAGHHVRESTQVDAILTHKITECAYAHVSGEDEEHRTDMNRKVWSCQTAQTSTTLEQGIGTEMGEDDDLRVKTNIHSTKTRIATEIPVNTIPRDNNNNSGQNSIKYSIENHCTGCIVDGSQVFVPNTDCGVAQISEGLVQNPELNRELKRELESSKNSVIKNENHWSHQSEVIRKSQGVLVLTRSTEENAVFIPKLKFEFTPDNSIDYSLINLPKGCQGKGRAKGSDLLNMRPYTPHGPSFSKSILKRSSALPSHSPSTVYKGPLSSSNDGTSRRLYEMSNTSGPLYGIVDLSLSFRNNLPEEVIPPDIPKILIPDEDDDS